ncbi:MAG TPA: hypothetical protein VHH36_03650 [Candidatus Thermoplasmatota archaeon]|nr:hypothetical protein [Candidatus Thermoplasmatota archaeon]
MGDGRAAGTCEACARPDGKKRSVIAMALLCAHCSLTAAAAVATALLAGAPTIFGVGLAWILPPFFLLGLFAFLVWPRKPLEHDHPDAAPTDRETA